MQLHMFPGGKSLAGLGRCVALFESRLPLRQLYEGIGDTFHQASH